MAFITAQIGISIYMREIIYIQYRNLEGTVAKAVIVRKRPENAHIIQLLQKKIYYRWGSSVENQILLME